MSDTYARIIDRLADMWVAAKGIAAELDAWNAQPRRGVIFINGVASDMESITEIPADNVPAKVDWQDRLGGSIAHSKTDTSWSAEDETGAASQAVSVNPDLDSDSDDETATVVFSASEGMFRVVATTPGADGATVRAQSGLYSIVPGAPAVGVITVG